MVESTEERNPGFDWQSLFKPGEKANPIQTLNISLIGMMAVGKTSIIKKFIDPSKDI